MRGVQRTGGAIPRAARTAYPSYLSYLSSFRDFLRPPHARPDSTRFFHARRRSEGRYCVRRRAAAACEYRRRALEAQQSRAREGSGVDGRYSGMQVGDVVGLQKTNLKGDQLFLNTQKSGSTIYVGATELTTARPPDQNEANASPAARRAVHHAHCVRGIVCAGQLFAGRSEARHRHGVLSEGS